MRWDGRQSYDKNFGSFQVRVHGSKAAREISRSFVRRSF